MKNKFTILGCGSSLGSPWITNYSAKLKKNSKNIRTRCCAHIQKGDLSVLIDTSPDIKNQFLKNKITSLDAIIYTHEHADQTSGIFEMRPFYWKNKKKIPVYGSNRTANVLKKNHTFCFIPKHGYKPIMKLFPIKDNFKIKKNKTIISVAHRLSTIVNSNHIYYLKEGLLVEDGTFNELMNKNGEFYKIAQLQGIKNNTQD